MRSARSISGFTHYFISLVLWARQAECPFLYPLTPVLPGTWPVPAPYRRSSSVLSHTPAPDAAQCATRPGKVPQRQGCLAVVCSRTLRSGRVDVGIVDHPLSGLLPLPFFSVFAVPTSLLLATQTQAGSTYGISQYRKGPSPIDAAPRVAQAQAQGAMHYWQNVGSKGEHPPRTHP
ncbi:hypothetical protein PG996_001698 [Apiospora saccharicola]|uniref:Uncharacterized protein n=1 Tax=Apiospora saccharicola TaxID=335842 RepID=A0ABR1WHI0_9PEZI